jgi:hypothetical protein
MSTRLTSQVAVGPERADGQRAGGRGCGVKASVGDRQTGGCSDRQETLAWDGTEAAAAGRAWHLT